MLLHHSGGEIFEIFLMLNFQVDDTVKGLQYHGLPDHLT